MLNDDLQVYDSCHLKPILIPPRSRLYSLEPIGIGTSSVESLTSFLMRIAKAHSLKVNTIFTREISNYFEQEYLHKHSRKGLSTLFNRAAALNSDGVLASLLSQSLEYLTLKDNLSSLTLLPAKNVFSPRKLFRQHQAWCPNCYEEWNVANKPIYQPFLWNFESVKFCPRHLRPLKYKCPNCNHSIPWLTGQSQVGFCSRCNYWLGSLSCDQESINELDLSEYIWTSHNIGELLSLISSRSSSFQKDDIQKAVNLMIALISEGNVAAFARILNLPKNTVWMWSKGKSVPELRAILMMCYSLGISLVDFLALDKQAFQAIQVNSLKLSKNTRQKRATPRKFNHHEIEDYLTEILSSSNTPLTIREIARVLKIDRRTLYHHFPSLCKAISVKHRLYQKSLTEERIQNCCQEVETVVYQVLLAGEYPSETKVSKLISQPGYFRYKKVRETLARAKSELITQL